jgi:hypothetical protein
MNIDIYYALLKLADSLSYSAKFNNEPLNILENIIRSRTNQTWYDYKGLARLCFVAISCGDYRVIEPIFNICGPGAETIYRGFLNVMNISHPSASANLAIMYKLGAYFKKDDNIAYHYAVKAFEYGNMHIINLLYDLLMPNNREKYLEFYVRHNTRHGNITNNECIETLLLISKHRNESKLPQTKYFIKGIMSNVMNYFCKPQNDIRHINNNINNNNNNIIMHNGFDNSNNDFNNIIYISFLILIIAFVTIIISL